MAIIEQEHEEALRRVPMSWEDFLALPEDSRAEFVDGVAVMSPRPRPRHSAAMARLSAVLVHALGDLAVHTEGGLRLPDNRLRGPDLMVVADAVPDHDDETTWVQSVPVLVVEILSPSTRNEDTVVKSAEYAAAGIGQFWIVDPALRTIDVNRNVDGSWELLLHLDADQPTGEVAVAEHGVVHLDLDAVLRR